MTTTLTSKHQQRTNVLLDDSPADRSWFDETEADEQNRMAVSINKYFRFSCFSMVPSAGKCCA